MSACPTCGKKVDQWEPCYPDLPVHWEQLCSRCNLDFQGWWRRKSPYGFVNTDLFRDPDNAPSEADLNLFVATRLRSLAERKRQGKTILRCEATVQMDNYCRNFQVEEVGGRMVCKNCAGTYRRSGHFPYPPKTTDGRWLDVINGLIAAKE